MGGGLAKMASAGAVGALASAAPRPEITNPVSQNPPMHQILPRSPLGQSGSQNLTRASPISWVL
jgi:hypothetical protein